MKRIVSVFLCLVLMFYLTDMNVYSQEMVRSKEILRIDDARNAAMMSWNDIMSALNSSEAFLLRIDENSVIDIDKPYIVYDVENEIQEEVFYFPVVDRYYNRVVYLLEVIKIDDGYICNILDNYVDILNKIDYCNAECVMYKTGNIVYFETENKVVSTDEFYNGRVVVSSNVNQLLFERKSFEEKQVMVLERIQNLVEFNNYEWENEEQKLSARNYSSLILYRPMGQYSYGMCWAASVATVQNYLNHTVVTGFEVCTRMGIGYNTGGDIYDEQEALWLYNINYSKIRRTSLYWTELTTNIDAGYPIIINGFSTNGLGHAVTIYGYTGTSSDTNNVKIWNSNLNNGNGGEATISKNVGTFSDGNGNVFHWETTLSYY